MKSASPFYPRLPLQMATAAAGLIILVHLGLLQAAADEPELLASFSSGMLLLETLFAVIILALTARQPSLSSKQRRFWAMIAMFAVLNLVGEVVMLLVYSVFNDPSLEPFADLFYLTAYPILILGILLSPAAPTRPGERLKLLLDLFGIMIGSALVFWVFLFGPILHQRATDLLTLTIALAYPTLDLVLLWAVLIMTFRSNNVRQQGWLYVLVAGALLQVVTDSIYCYRDLVAPVPPGDLIELGWGAGILLLGLAGIWQINGSKDALTEEMVKQSNEPGYFSSFRAYFPYLALLAAFFLQVWGHVHPLTVSWIGMSVGIGGIIAVILVRQIIALQDNLQLYRDAQQEIARRKQMEAELLLAQERLEERVKERTLQLAESNQQLVLANSALHVEIDQRKQMEEQVRASLHEKEILLKEIHHRVKNNLQIISSLLNLQSENIQDQDTRQLFRDSQNRVRSMALIHEKIYQSQDLAHINFADYIHSLGNYLLRSLRPQSSQVSLRIDVQPVFLGLDEAIPCGLIVNELVSNSFKHAYPNGSQGEVYICFSGTEKGAKTMRIGDHGIGLPVELDFTNTTSLGLQLVNSLVDQIGGTIALNREEGTEFRIVFGDDLSPEQTL